MSDGTEAALEQFLANRLVDRFEAEHDRVPTEAEKAALVASLSMDGLAAAVDDADEADAASLVRRLLAS